MSIDDDRELQRFLEGKHAVSERYRKLPDAQPPRGLDESILAAARAEARRPVRPRWLVPLSVAATVVLGVGLSLRQIQTPSARLSDTDTAVEYRQLESAGERPVVTAPERPADAPPVPKPDVEGLLRAEPLAGAGMKKSTVDVESLREKALADTSRFEPPPLSEMSPLRRRRAPESEASEAFAPPPPRAPTDAGRRAIDADIGRALPAAPSPAAQEDQRPSARPSTDGSDESAAEADLFMLSRRDLSAQPNLRIENHSLNSLASSAAAPPETRQEAVARRLALIATLHARGEIESAQAMFDDLIALYPDIELPQDFPLQPSPPERPATSDR